MDASQLLIVIPARGGSKGLPGKNAKVLDGHPLLKWTSDALRLSGLENYQCVLSTDDKEIASIGEGLGLNVPFIRPDELATDTATTIDVVKHALDWFDRKQDFQAKYLMVLQPTSPFRPPQSIYDAFHLLTETDTDAVISTRPIHRALGSLFYTDENNNMTPLEQQVDPNTHRQSVRTLYTPNGAIYAIKCNALKTQQTLFPEKSQSMIMDQVQSHDIDDPTDWAIATSLANTGLSWRANMLGATE